MSQTVYIVATINKNEFAESVSTARAFLSKEKALNYVRDTIFDYNIDNTKIVVNPNHTNWYTDEDFDIALFENELD